MGFGASIAIGSGNRPLDEDLAACLAEVRVEQSLDEPTIFAVRFADDIEDGQMRLASDERLNADAIVTISVEVDQETVVLVRGPITEHRSEMTIGGPGSWFEIHCLDRRDLLDRTCVPGARTGRASELAQGILTRTFDEVEVEETAVSYGPNTTTLNQSSTDLAFLRQIARRNGLCLWITYRATRSPFGGQLKVTETANFASSPRRPAGGAAAALVSALPLKATTPLALRIHVPSKDCPNVTAFQIVTDARRPNAYRTGAMQMADANPATTDVTDPQPPPGNASKRLPDIAGVRRDLCMPGAGDPLETQTRGEAALAEAGFCVQATASTTKHLLGGVLKPHDVVSAIGVGPKFGKTTFRVKQVTHVIHAVEHFMDLTLETNGLGD